MTKLISDEDVAALVAMRSVIADAAGHTGRKAAIEAIDRLVAKSESHRQELDWLCWSCPTCTARAFVARVRDHSWKTLWKLYEDADKNRIEAVVEQEENFITDGLRLRVQDQREHPHTWLHHNVIDRGVDLMTRDATLDRTEPSQALMQSDT